MTVGCGVLLLGFVNNIHTPIKDMVTVVSDYKVFSPVKYMELSFYLFSVCRLIAMSSICALVLCTFGLIKGAYNQYLYVMAKGYRLTKLYIRHHRGFLDFMVKHGKIVFSKRKLSKDIEDDE